MKLHDLDHMVKMDEYADVRGYPQCCRTEFVNRTDSQHKSRRERNLTGSGYIPCKECNKKYSGIELILRIQKKRTWPISFIEEVWEMDIDGIEWVNNNYPGTYKMRRTYGEFAITR